MINIQENVILAPYTNFKIGGSARYFTEVKNEEELKESLAYAQANQLEFFVLSGGSNVLFSDKGFNGLVIRIQNTKYKILDTKIECGAGVSLAKIVNLTIENSLTGFEWAAGIPGTIGGAVRGNAGAFGSDMNNIVEKVSVFARENEVFKKKDYTKEECQFDYRNSLFKHNQNLVIISAVLNLKKGEKEKIQSQVNETIFARRKKLPIGVKTVGSFFMNPKVENAEIIKEFETETGQKSKSGIIPAGWLIESVGLKGKKIGGAMVSEEHGNCIVNADAATAEDVIILASLIKQKVRAKFEVQLMEEVMLVGF